MCLEASFAAQASGVFLEFGGSSGSGRKRKSGVTQWHSERECGRTADSRLLFCPHIHGEVGDFTRTSASRVPSCRIRRVLGVPSGFVGGGEGGRMGGWRPSPRPGGNSETQTQQFQTSGPLSVTWVTKVLAPGFSQELALTTPCPGPFAFPDVQSAPPEDCTPVSAPEATFPRVTDTSHHEHHVSPESLSP